MGRMEQEEIRRGPWTGNEDVQLDFYVNMFGDRRWDFIAHVSGLKRTGKSCRLRWVNYLQPGLKRGKMAPQEERRVLELHSKWGNRWSRIARKLPGRTDNEIKNYWRTHTRKKAQERKRNMSPTCTVSNCSSSSSSNALADSMPIMECFSCSTNPSANSIPVKETKHRSFYDTGGDSEMLDLKGEKDKEVEESEKVYAMDDIWKDIDLFENDTLKSIQTMASPIWDYWSDLMWMMEEEDSKMFPAINDHIFGNSNLTG